MSSTLALSTSEAIDQAAAIFDHLDVAESTRAEYNWRIGAFVAFLDGGPLTTESYLQFNPPAVDRDLAGRMRLGR